MNKYVPNLYSKQRFVNQDIQLELYWTQNEQLLNTMTKPCNNRVPNGKGESEK